LFILSFIGALGIIWSFKFSNNNTLQKLAPINNLRLSITLLIFTNFSVLIYLIIHAKFISQMLIVPGFLESNDGSGGGFFWSEKLAVWNKNKQDNYEFYKFIKEAVFVSFNIFIFLLALYLRKRNNSKINVEITKKTNLIVTVLLIIFSLFLTYLALVGILLTIDEYSIWEGG